MKLAIWGDNQNGRHTFNKAIQFFNTVGVKGYISLGDHVRNGNINYSWMADLFDQTEGAVLSLKYNNWFPCIGERDFAGKKGREFSYRYLPHTYPKGYYIREFGPLLVVSLSNFHNSKEQIKFLYEECTKDRWCKLHKIAIIHKPEFLNIKHSKLIKVCENLGIKAFLSGHHHYYSHGCKNDNHYIISGGAGGKLHFPPKLPFWKILGHKKTEVTHHVGILTVFDDRLEFSFYNLEDEKMFDCFNVWK